jgi:hypothetical protein
LVKAVLMSMSILRAKFPGLVRENGGNTETGRFASCTSADEVIAMLVGDGDARDGLDDLRLLAAGDLVIELSWSSNTKKWTKVAKTSGAKLD